MTFSTRLITVLSLLAVTIFFTPTKLKADIYHFESFTGFPDDNMDGMEDWTFDGWIETSHFGFITNEGVLDDWFMAVTTPYDSFNLTPHNSSMSYGNQDGNPFYVNPFAGTISKEIISNDSLTFSLDADPLLQVRLGNTSDVLLQTLTNFGFATNVSVTRDPPNPIFASTVPEPGVVPVALIGICCFLMRRRKRSSR